MPKTQEKFQKTQVFANSELEIVVEKRPKKEPALLAGALMFCVQSFQDYWMGKRSYAGSKEPITLNDLPKITFRLQ